MASSSIRHTKSTETPAISPNTRPTTGDYRSGSSREHPQYTARPWPQDLAWTTPNAMCGPDVGESEHD